MVQEGLDKLARGGGSGPAIEGSLNSITNTSKL